MKIYTVVAAAALSLGLASCSDDYFDTEYHRGVNSDGALSNTTIIQSALTGAYAEFYDYRFAGNYAMNIGDIPTDLSYWNTQTGHFDDIYRYSYDDTDLYLGYIWMYGYKVVDYTARVIKAGNALTATVGDEDKATLEQELAEAYALRAYANLLLVNVYGHQIKVNGQDFSSQPGIVISDEPIEVTATVSRSTVGESYKHIVDDLKQALAHFANCDGGRSDKTYINQAAAEGLLARVYLYMEDWGNAKTYAQKALTDAQINGLTYTTADYKALYNGGASNTESLFYLSIDASHNWSANSCGTLWSTYNYSPSPKLQAMYSDTDVRKAIMGWDKTSTESVPVYAGGKFAAYGSGNPANATSYLINAPEMYLIMAEADLQKGNLSNAQSELLVVAKRNTAIATVADLPQTKDALYSFLKDERARELFQEGLRLWDLRRWGDVAQVEAYNAPAVTFRSNNYNISDLVFPIPADEINAKKGVTQNEGWNKLVPQTN